MKLFSTQSGVLSLLLVVCIMTLSPVHRALGQTRTPFTDVPDSHWAVDAVEQLANDGLVIGWEDRFMGNKTFTRYEMAQILAPLIRQFKEIYSLIKKQEISNAMSSLVGKQAIDNISAEERQQLTSLLALVDSLQNAIERQNLRLDRLEQKSSPAKSHDIAELRNDLARLKQSLSGLKPMSPASAPVYSAPSDDLDLEQLRVQVAANTDQVLSNTDILDGIMHRQQNTPAQTVTTIPDTTHMTGNNEEVKNLIAMYEQLKEQLALNTERLTNVTVSGAVSTVKIQELEKLTRICKDLESRISNNSEVLTNVLVKSSVNEVNIGKLQVQ